MALANYYDVLFQILRVLSETAVAVRTKAMKCLTAVVESDPGILARVSKVICKTCQNLGWEL